MWDAQCNVMKFFLTSNKAIVQVVEMFSIEKEKKKTQLGVFLVF